MKRSKWALTTGESLIRGRSIELKLFGEYMAVTTTSNWLG